MKEKKNTFTRNAGAIIPLDNKGIDRHLTDDRLLTKAHSLGVNSLIYVIDFSTKISIQMYPEVLFHLLYLLTSV